MGSFFVCVFSLDFDGQMSKATESFELEKNYPLANGQVDLWVMTHALCAARKCSVWSGGSILSSVFTFQWSYTHDYDESGPQSSGLRSGTQTTICASIFFLSLSLCLSLRHLDSPNAAVAPTTTSRTISTTAPMTTSTTVASTTLTTVGSLLLFLLVLLPLSHLLFSRLVDARALTLSVPLSGTCALTLSVCGQQPTISQETQSSAGPVPKPARGVAAATSISVSSSSSSNPVDSHSHTLQTLFWCEYCGDQTGQSGSVEERTD